MLSASERKLFKEFLVTHQPKSRCKVCSSPHLELINDLIHEAKAPQVRLYLREVKKYTISENALRNHWLNHVK